MSKRTRRNYTSEQKASVLKKHLVENVPISDICDEQKLQPSLYYYWQRQLFESAERAEEQRGAESGEGARSAHRAARGQAGEEGLDHRGDQRGVRGAKKRAWGALNGRWVPHDTRDEVVDFVRTWADKTELPAERFIGWLDIGRKFFDWKKRYGKANEHNALVPCDFWSEPSEKRAIIDFHGKDPLEGYRRLTFTMLDQDVVAVSPATVYRVLSKAGRLDRWNRKPSKKGIGVVQPLRPHEQ